MAMNIAQMTTENTRVAPMSELINVLPPIFVNRFILNLRSHDATSGAGNMTTGDARLSRFSAPNFRVPDSFLGNIGEPLEAGQDSGMYDDDEGYVEGEMEPETPGETEEKSAEEKSVGGDVEALPTV
ncbi:hypothetical protein PsYK624_100100 [Phanerochaete sordida]|uniref:Uncharacterized protein n=1 Tax=Phanerochaete sordida TaxID=48140 RepID=A0A9P3GF92_9APHY|nr:hypothetical protein PsYK624_100100 [Phanerochaete sordida]